MSINKINAEAKESLRKYFKNSQDVKHENEERSFWYKMKNLYRKLLLYFKKENGLQYAGDIG